MINKEDRKRKLTEAVIVIIVIIIFAAAIIAVSIYFSEKKENTDIHTNGDSNVSETNSKTDSQEDKIIKTENDHNLNKLSENATEYEGRKGTGDFNYGEALQKAILFYDLQRSGDLPEQTRCNWRGDSGLEDGSDAGIDLTGGFYDAGDHVKFNLPMAYTGTMLSWSLFEDYESYKESGQTDYILDNIKWVNDYLIKCHPEDNVYYYQIGDGSLDHAWWGPCEVMQMERPSFKVDEKNPGSAVTAEAAASLAACSKVYKQIDEKYSDECLSHSKSLFEFAEKTMSDEGYTAANGYYNSWSGFYDELAWASVWLYIATDKDEYLKKSEEYVEKAEGNYKWAQCWDDVYTGTCLLLAKYSEDKKYGQLLEKNLDYWTDGFDGEKITYSPDGLAWLDQWGSLRYATTEAFLAGIYSECSACPDNKKQKYWDFAVSQVNYALGSTGRSFVVGFGENPPKNPHHRTAHCSYSNNMNEPEEEVHTLYGALVGGPDSSGKYEDKITNYTVNEVACDYNAGFVGALAKLYKKYGGQTLVNFGAVEDPDHNEIYTEASVNASGTDFTEIKALLYNKTSWPARVTDKLELRYFIDLSEIYSSGGTCDDVEISLNYAQDEVSATLVPWNEDKHIYYASLDFSGVKLYPGGQDSYKKEVQFRLKSKNGTWDNSNDYSYSDVENTNGSSLCNAEHFAIYDSGELVYGSEPDGKSNINKPVTSKNKKPDTTSSNDSDRSSKKQNLSADNGDIEVSIDKSQQSGGSNTIYFSVSVKNSGDNAISTDALEMLYYFSADGAAENDLTMSCDNSAVSSDSGYTPVSKISGSFSKIKSDDPTADMLCTVSTDQSVTINPGDIYKVQIRINKADWSDFNLSNDYSSQDAENIVIKSNDKIIFGKDPH